jgi:hypothetical protein
MTLNSTLGLIIFNCSFHPDLFHCNIPVRAYKTFPALMIYYAAVFIYNLMTEGYIQADPAFIRYWGLTITCSMFPCC